MAAKTQLPKKRISNGSTDFLFVEAYGDSENEADVGIASDEELDISDLTTLKLSEDLNLVRRNEQLLDSATNVNVFGSIEKLMFEVGKLSTEIEVMEVDIQVKQQLFETYKLIAAEAKEVNSQIEKKLSALGSSYSSSKVCLQQREAQARAAVTASKSHLDQRKGELIYLQALEDEMAGEYETMVAEFQHHLYEMHLEESVSKILEEGLQIQLGKLEELHRTRDLAAEKTTQLLDARSQPCFLLSEKIEELPSVRKYAVEAKSLLGEGGQLKQTRPEEMAEIGDRKVQRGVEGGRRAAINWQLGSRCGLILAVCMLVVLHRSFGCVYVCN